MNYSNERKFIPIMRKGTFKNAIPTFLAGKLWVVVVKKNCNKKGYNKRF